VHCDLWSYFVRIRAIRLPLLKEGWRRLLEEVRFHRVGVREIFHNVVRKNPPCTVFVPKPLSMPYAEAMGRLHRWLDRRKLQATGFKITTDGRIGFEVCFSSEREAMEFQLFDWER
jgi:hypothetical protein